MARVGLGSLGVVSEVTLQCVPAHHLLEHTYVSTHKVTLPVSLLVWCPQIWPDVGGARKDSDFTANLRFVL